jgi:CDP-glycerol glycerophosphotransferase (TagB/SpsB family)
MNFFWWILSLLIPRNKKLVIINTLPDFDDGCRALLIHLNKYGFKVIVISNTKYPKIPFWLNHNPPQKIYYKLSFMGIFSYHRAYFVIFTHGIFSKFLPNNKLVLNIWHGMPIKKINIYENSSQDPAKFSYTIAEKDNYRQIMSFAFQVPISKVLLLSNPRIDILSIGQRKNIDSVLPSYKYLAMWMPTFRDIKIDSNGNPAGLNNSLDSIDFLDKCNNYFYNKNIVCLFRPHSLSKFTSERFSNYSNIIYVDDNFLQKVKMSNYELLGVTDFMITDISSCYYDYQKTGKPIVIYFEDIIEYSINRGFIMPLLNIFNEPILTDILSFFNYIDFVINKINTSNISIKNNSTYTKIFIESTMI